MNGCEAYHNIAEAHYLSDWIARRDNCDVREVVEGEEFREALPLFERLVELTDEALVLVMKRRVRIIVDISETLSLSETLSPDESEEWGRIISERIKTVAEISDHFGIDCESLSHSG
jgi:hypothetical protein